MKPGAFLLAFGGTRTYHRMTCAIEDAGFEVRDCVMWVYGQGFAKQKGLLKPAWEPIVVARKNVEGTAKANIAKYGTGALNTEACKVRGDDAPGGEYVVKRLKPGATLERTGGSWRPEEGGVEYHGRTTPGRWPANLIHDGSDEVLEAFPVAPGQLAAARRDGARKKAIVYGAFKHNSTESPEPRNDSGSAARFFYCVKANAKDRAGSKHPTVKPLALMRYLVRLATPPGGTVLDPFAGSGTTMQAAVEEGFRVVGIERETDYTSDIKRRMARNDQTDLIDYIATAS